MPEYLYENHTEKIMAEFHERQKTIKGDIAEAYFLELIRKIKPQVIIVTASTEQNRREHWDYRIITNKADITVDVKAPKNCGLSGDSWTILEIFDWQGKLGWLYGEADYIAFQSGCSFVFSKRTDLVEYHLQHTQDIKVADLKDAHHKLYTRTGAKDLITIINMNDLRAFSKIIKSN